MIKAVLFDFGGVLTQSGKSGFIRQIIADLYGRDPQDIEIGDLHYLLRRGQGDENLFFTELNQRYGGNITKEQFVSTVQANFTPSQEVYDLAAALRKHGIRTGILSNVFSMNARRLQSDGWYDNFDPLILSCDVGFAKPELEIYDYALRALNLPGSEALFVDDQQKCMPPAVAMGMYTVVAHSPKQIVDDTKKIIHDLNGISL